MDGMLLALVLTAAGIAVLLSGWSWLRPGEPKQSEPRWVQPAVLALIAAVGLAWALWLRSTVNPHWLPVGQDAWDFLAYPLSYLDSDLGHRTDTRHPLAPWLAVQLFRATDLGLHQAVLLITVLSTGLLPLAVYLLVRQLAPWPVALVGSMLAAVQPLVLTYATQPSVYPFAALLRISALALVVSLARTRLPLWPGALTLGCVLACLMGTVLTALPTLAISVGAVGLLVAWKIASERRWRDLAALPALVLPVVVGWVLLSPTAHERSCLEGSTHAVARQEYRAFTWEQGLEVPEPGLEPPNGVGWTVHDRLHDWGWWKAGSPSSLRHLPETARYFLGSTRAPVQAEAFGEHLATKAAAMVRDEVGIGTWPLATLVLMAFAGFRRSPGHHRWIPWLLVVLVGTISLLLPLQSAFNSAPRPRYLFELVACGPALLLAGAISPLRASIRPAWRAPTWPWLLLLPALTIAWHASRYGDLAARAGAQLETERSSRTMHPLRQVLTLRNKLQRGDVVIDLAEACAHGPAAMVYDRAEVVAAELLTLHEIPAALRPLQAGAARYLVLDCAWIPELSYEPKRQAVKEALYASPRFRRLTPCILVDRTPDQPLSLGPPAP